MGKTIAGVTLGAIVYFLWGWVSWVAMPWYNKVILPLPEENLIRDTLKITVEKPGMYVVPSRVRPDGEIMTMEAFEEHFQRGPVAFMSYHPGGLRPMSPVNLLIGLIIAFAISKMAYFVLLFSRDKIPSYAARVMVVSSLGVFAWFYAHVSYWNWFHFSTAYTSVVLVDTLIGFTLVGLVVAKFIPKS